MLCFPPFEMLCRAFTTVTSVLYLIMKKHVGLTSRDWPGSWRISYFLTWETLGLLLQYSLAHYPFALWSTVWSIFQNVAESIRRTPHQNHKLAVKVLDLLHFCVKKNHYLNRDNLTPVSGDELRVLWRELRHRHITSNTRKSMRFHWHSFILSRLKEPDIKTLTFPEKQARALPPGQRITTDQCVQLKLNSTCDICFLSGLRQCLWN